MSGWDPARYLAFGDQRLLPGLDLIDALPKMAPRSIADLGCGTGKLTALLASKWPTASVVGIDSSEEMLAEAKRKHPRLQWLHARIEDWTAPADLIFSNAALHWLGDHAALLPRLRSQLSEGGVLAIQMPCNWTEPTHTIPATILDGGEWSDEARHALPRNRVAEADTYRAMLPTAQVWENVYEQSLAGDDPVFEWGMGSFLRPVWAALRPEERPRFEEACKRAYRDAYPRKRDGTTVLPYRRLFIIATMTAAAATSAPS